MSQNWTPPAAAGTAPVPNYVVDLVLAIVSLVVSLVCGWCGLPLAIPALIFAIQVNSKIAAGDIQGAQDASKKARIFSFIAIGIAVLLWIIIILYYILVIGLAVSQTR